MGSTDVLLFAFSVFSRLHFAIAPDLAARVERPEWCGSCVAARLLHTKLLFETPALTPSLFSGICSLRARRVADAGINSSIEHCTTLRLIQDSSPCALIQFVVERSDIST